MKLSIFISPEETVRLDTISPKPEPPTVRQVLAHYMCVLREYEENEKIAGGEKQKVDQVSDVFEMVAGNLYWMYVDEENKVMREQEEILGDLRSLAREFRNAKAKNKTKVESLKAKLSTLFHVSRPVRTHVRVDALNGFLSPEETVELDEINPIPNPPTVRQVLAHYMCVLDSFAKEDALVASGEKVIPRGWYRPTPCEMVAENIYRIYGGDARKLLVSQEDIAENLENLANEFRRAKASAYADERDSSEAARLQKKLSAPFPVFEQLRAGALKNPEVLKMLNMLNMIRGGMGS